MDKRLELENFVRAHDIQCRHWMEERGSGFWRAIIVLTFKTSKKPHYFFGWGGTSSDASIGAAKEALDYAKKQQSAAEVKKSTVRIL